MARISGIDLPRDKKVEIGLTYIYGIGRASAQQIIEKAGIDSSLRIRDLTDADVTIQRSQGAWRVLPAATLSADHAATLGTTGAAAGDQITITRLDATANAYAVINGGAGAGTLVTFPASKIGFGVFQYDGTNWALREVGSL